MKKVTQLSKSTEVSPVRWILGGLAVITLYFQTNLADPFNSPKLWILLIVAAWLVGYIISFRNIILASKELKLTFYFLSIFIFFSLLATIFTDFKYIAFFGDTQRRNGFTAYISLATILLAASMFIRLFNIKRLYMVVFFIATVSAIYAFMQTNGKDFVNWNNPYNSIIGTVGNPNFAAAVMAVMGVIMFATIFIKEFAIYFRLYAAILAMALLGLIYKSNARQGFLAYILGVGIFLIIWLYGKNRRLAILSAGSGILVFVLAVLGMLQIGPLEKFLYKPSVSVRGYYWRAGFEMVKQHPLFGIGMDRYGAYFKQYREVGYPLSYGFDITSSNAHNTFIQLFATGGIFLGASYLLLNAYIFRRAIAGLKNLTGNDRLLLAGTFSAWLAFHAQSLVSIDNIGISIWGWVLGGSIIGISISSNTSAGDDRKFFIGKLSEINISRAITSATFLVVPIVLISFLYRGEVNTYNAKQGFDLQNPSAQVIFKDFQLKVINSRLNDPNYKLSSAMSLVQNGFADEGLLLVKEINLNDPRNLDALNALALTSEQLNKISDAIIYREKMAKLDPWNAVNYLALGKDYKAQGDLVKSKEMLDKILSFSTGNIGSPIAEQAKTELVS
jgi:O-antigen ligase